MSLNREIIRLDKVSEWANPIGAISSKKGIKLRTFEVNRLQVESVQDCMAIAIVIIKLRLFQFGD